MSRRVLIAAAILVMTSMAGGGVIAVVNAYSVNGPQPAVPAPSIPSITNFNLNGLSAPFQNFFQSINASMSSAGSNSPANLPSMTIPSIPQNATFASWIQNGFQQFDAWLYSIAGFHISGLFIAILNILSWILGLVKNAVDWLLGVIH